MRKILLLICLTGWASASLITAQTQHAPAQYKTLSAAVEQSHKALAAILNGDLKLYEELFADRDDITLGNPFGPFAKGRSQVATTLAGAAAKYSDGTVLRIDLVAKYVNADFACLVEVEHDRAKVGASQDPSEFSVRVTSVYERIRGGWRLVHRHADPITSVQPAESVLQK